jgi:hypothetical protein
MNPVFFFCCWPVFVGRLCIFKWPHYGRFL